MDKLATENLFLLEFLVDKLELDPNCSCNEVNNEFMKGDEVCASVQFLDNAPLDICEQDFSTRANYGVSTSKLKNGKSCLFSLTSDQVMQAVQDFDIYVEVFRKMREGVLPNKLVLGTSLISIVNLFNELLQLLSESTEQGPAAKTLKDSFGITSQEGEVIGYICIYIRMSCFGKLIVTQFQMNLDDKSVLFKDKRGSSLYRYKKASKSGELGNIYGRRSTPTGREGMYGRGIGADSGCLMWDGRRNPNCPKVSCGSQTLAPSDFPCNECGQYSPQSATMPNLTYHQPPAANTNMGCYREIGAELGGNAVTIRLRKDEKVEKMQSPGTLRNEICACSPGNFGRQSRPQERPAIGMPEQQNFTMRPGISGPGNQNSPFNLRMGGCNTADDNKVMVVPPVCTAPDGTQIAEISDPNKEVFVLRIGKKKEGVEQKNNIELELTTPRSPERKPPPEKDTKDTQYDEMDIPKDVPTKEKPEKGKKDKKGKGGKKDKKGKKGKKK